MVVKKNDPALCSDLQGKGLGIDKHALNGPVKNAVDKYQLVPEFLKVRGLVKQHLQSFNYFVTTQIKKVVQANNLITSYDNPNIYLRYTDVNIGKPSSTVNFISEDITPQRCRLSDFTYAAPINVNVEFFDGKSTQIQHNLCIGRMPIMLRSCCCILHGKDEEELARYGECPLDPGGYFVIKGAEKVILIQEQLSKNRIIIDTDPKGCVQASVTSSSDKLKSKTVIKMEKEKINLHLNNFTSKVPIMVVLKAMGMECDQEIVQMIGRDPRYSEMLLPSIQECVKDGIHTRHQALEFLEQKVKKNPFSATTEKEGSALRIIRDIFLANIPVHEENFRPKCIYIAVMLRRMMDAILNKDTMDDKDYMGNKRLELSGQMLSLLFEDLFKSMNEEVRKKMDKLLTKPNRSSPFTFAQIMKNDRITVGLERALSTGKWDVKRFRMNRTGITEAVVRLSYIATLGQMTKIKPQFDKTSKVSGPRALQPSQWGMLCPCDTPEGAGTGLIKNLALMTHVTTDEDEGPIKSVCSNLGVEDLELFSAEEVHMPNFYLVIFNGLILGMHRKPHRFTNSMRKLRRRGKIGEFVSIFVNDKQHCIYIACDGGRVCRPLVIADKGVSRIKEHHMKELRDGVRNFHSFLKEGLIEYLDVNEENNALIALYEENAKEGTTHIEIEPFTILGIIAGLIPYPHHNQSPRNTYQCAMGKQAMGNIAYNQALRVKGDVYNNTVQLRNVEEVSIPSYVEQMEVLTLRAFKLKMLRRMDNLMYLLVYPQRPLLTTRTIELVRYDKLGAGQNATVAVMSYSGYDIEDAIVMNKSSLDRGFGRCIVTKKISAVQKKYPESGTSDRVVKPQRTDYDFEKLQILDDDGLAAPGEIIRPDDVYINKQSPIVAKDKNIKQTSLTDSQYRPTKQRYSAGIEGETTVVDQVALCSDKDTNLCFKFMIRHTRRPEIGDKFSSRHGQKGVVGTIIHQEDFPFSERGICPDLIMNPHGFPSRMTVGKLIELLGSKAGVSCGRFHYGSAFGEPSGHADKVEDTCETLVKHGFSYNGKDFIYSGITGEPLQAYIFMGPIYYQKLKHMVIDKMHARGQGPRELITRQPTAGKGRNGGLRMGEMERDCLIAYGASMLTSERLVLCSDAFETQVCQKCGLLGYYNYKMKTGMCSMCKSGENISTMKLPYAAKLLIQELQSMNIVPRLKLAEA